MRDEASNGLGRLWRGWVWLSLPQFFRIHLPVTRGIPSKPVLPVIPSLGTLRCFPPLLGTGKDASETKWGLHPWLPTQLVWPCVYLSPLRASHSLPVLGGGYICPPNTHLSSQLEMPVSGQLSPTGNVLGVQLNGS